MGFFIVLKNAVDLTHSYFYKSYRQNDGKKSVGVSTL